MTTVQYHRQVRPLGISELVYQRPDGSYWNSKNIGLVICVDTLVMGTHCFHMPVVRRPPCRSNTSTAMAGKEEKHCIVVHNTIIMDEAVLKSPKNGFTRGFAVKEDEDIFWRDLERPD